MVEPVLYSTQGHQDHLRDELKQNAKGPAAEAGLQIEFLRHHATRKEKLIEEIHRKRVRPAWGLQVNQFDTWAGSRLATSRRRIGRRNPRNAKISATRVLPAIGSSIATAATKSTARSRYSIWSFAGPTSETLRIDTPARPVKVAKRMFPIEPIISSPLSSTKTKGRK